MNKSVLKICFDKVYTLFVRDSGVNTSINSGNMYQNIAAQRWEQTLNKINLANDAVTTTQLSFTL